MAINTGDTRIAVVAEVTPGVTPATPVFSMLDYLPGSAVREAADTGNLNTRKANRSSSGQYLSARRAEGQLDVEFKRDAAIELLLESALGGTWTSNVLKGGTGLKSLTVEETFYDAGTPQFRRSTGCMVDFSLEAEFNGPAQATFQVIGLAVSYPGAIVAGATYTPSSSKPVIMGEKITNVTVGSLTGIIPTGISLSVAHEREAKQGFGTLAASFIGTGRRTVEGMIRFLASDLQGIALGGTTVAISFTMETGVNGYSFSIPSASIGMPSDSEDGTALEIEIPFVADFNVAQSSDIVVTRLA
jgi:hypothetical protein